MGLDISRHGISIIIFSLTAIYICKILAKGVLRISTAKLPDTKNFTLYFNSTKLVCVIATGKPFTGKLNKTGIVGKYLFPNLDAKTFSGIY